jgi:ankyrin repeat protein
MPVSIAERLCATFDRWYRRRCVHAGSGPRSGVQGDPAQRAEALVRSACSFDTRPARELLAADPALARHDLACACVCGEADEVARALAGSPETSRLPRTDPARGPGIRQVVGLLLDAGADPNASFDHEGWLQVPLYGAAGIRNDAELTQMLIEAGADANDVSEKFENVGEALYHACEFPDPTCAAMLIDAGTQQFAVDYCLGRALNFPYAEMVEMFCAHGARADAGHLHQAVWRRRPARTVRVLLDAGAPVDEPDQGGLTPLQIATRWGEEEVAAVLTEAGADASRVRDEDGRLGAFVSGRANGFGGATGLDAMLQSAVEQGDLDVARRLLDAGALVDGDPASDEIPLGHACWRGHAAIASELIDRGAQMRFRDGGSAIGAALHGSRHCQHPEGGPTMKTVEEVPKDRYAAVVTVLLQAHAPLPDGPIDGTSIPVLISELGLEPPA